MVNYESPSKYAKNPEDVPFGEHFAIHCCISTYTPGDERSRTNPGHGYPESTLDSWDYEIYQNVEKWNQAIEYKTLKAIGLFLFTQTDLRLKNEFL